MFLIGKKVRTRQIGILLYLLPTHLLAKRKSDQKDKERGFIFAAVSLSSSCQYLLFESTTFVTRINCPTFSTRKFQRSFSVEAVYGVSSRKADQCSVRVLSVLQQTSPVPLAS